jgi:hypothetical protein
LQKKNLTQIEIEHELEALINRKMVIRRGRNNRLLLKMVEIDTFDETSASDEN